MKKITLLIFAVAIASFSFAQIWVSPITTGRPINDAQPYYVGDKINSEGDWWFQFEIGQAAWNASEVGIGQNPDGETNWNWGAAEWYKDGDGSNKKVQRNIGSFQFTAAGEWYVVGRARSAEADDWTYGDEGDWTNDQTLTASTTDKACPYFTVSALESPLNAQAADVKDVSLKLTWEKFAGKDVVIVRYPKGATETAPETGTVYNAGDPLGEGRVIYRGGEPTFQDNGLTAETEYDYYLYSENYGYYSPAATVTVKTTSVVVTEIGNSFVTIQKATDATEIWYSASGSGHGSFNDADLGTFDTKDGKTFTIGGEIQAYPNTTTPISMFYQIDNGTSVEVVLPKTGDEGDGGANSKHYGTASVDFSALAEGNHKIAVWFNIGDVWDSNNSSNYIANFTVVKTLTGIEQPSHDLVTISSSKGTILAQFNGIADVKLFSASGSLLVSQKTDSQFTQKVPAGIYILSVNGKPYKAMVK